MSSSQWTSKSIETSSQAAEQIATWLDQSDAVLIGAGAGLSVACGPEFAYTGKRFERLYGDFAQRYGFYDEYSGGFYPYDSQEEFWAWWYRVIWNERYAGTVGNAYLDLSRIVNGRDYFVLTTNVDHQFQRAGFDKKRLFYTQGYYGLFQCSVPCHRRTYDNYDAVRQMVNAEQDLRIPTELIPRCPICGEPMTMNLRVDGRFVEDEGWHAAARRYDAFVREHAHDKVLYLEIGVGANTPGIIKYPFWQQVAENRNARYVQLNMGGVIAPARIAERSALYDGDAAEVISKLA
ncbi:Sir2 silent information regulator family NAD-dependent deacetylase [Olsenella sp. AF21-51]|jgi:NAD-dependent SIR2 family protein deacetylase|uniref:SIR2 family NAD-dependent protein deacylase n=1 Tax=Olsenella sp. AF21-51 TaxID=2292239 RepID=UPI000E49FC17|nr:Sir2 silent information regulator family NAD-dependent deacetylase [Olsenella sp. AF21-51]RGS52649.1 Sir2 silent information regulator family NAD-dependent deacetylase [Olsenella sp. AF21-51]